MRWFRRSLSGTRRWSGALAVLLLASLALPLLLPTVGRVRESARRSVDSSNIRQVVQSLLIASNDFNGGPLPDVRDYRELAVFLARHGGLNDANCWVSLSDFFAPTGLSTVVDGQGAPMRNFLDAPLTIAVGLPTPTTNMPSHTPVAWTRGLRDDGTWPEDGPYEGQGGYVAFLGGNVAWFQSGDVLKRVLRFDGQPNPRTWSEVLPPGSVVSEWRPTEEQLREARVTRALWKAKAELKRAANDPSPREGSVLGVMIIAGMVLLFTSFLRLGSPRFRRIARIAGIALLALVALVVFLAS
jgi:hypothetical protein